MKTLVDDAATAVDHAMPSHHEESTCQVPWSQSVAVSQCRIRTLPPWPQLPRPWRVTGR